jgi:hypothetical protein
MHSIVVVGGNPLMAFFEGESKPPGQGGGGLLKVGIPHA